MPIRDVATSLELHALDVPHNDGHLCPLRRLVEQRHLAEVICGLGSSLACTFSVRSILEAWVSLWACRLCLLAHGAEEVLLLARGWRVEGHGGRGRGRL